MTTSVKDRPLRDRSRAQKTLGLIANLALREIKSQYNRTVLGRLWSLLNPLATIAVFSLIFGLVFRGAAHEGLQSGVNSFPLWIATGVITWGFISGSISGGMNAFISNSALLTKVYFPRWVLVISSTIAAVVQFASELLVIMVIMAIASGSLYVFLMILPLVLLVLLTAVFTTGIGLLLAIGVVYFRDIQHLWGIFNQVWMYASGVVFPLAMLEDVQVRLFDAGWQLGGQPLPLVTIFRLNPAEQFLEAYRALLYDFVLPDWTVLVSCVLWAAAALGLGALVYSRHYHRLVEEL